ncbi:MAG TPA: methyltransferase domain-containing protein [bacterium]|nr:methyltransferase domain-containing protein [bacterium]
MADIYSDGTYLTNNPGWGAADAAWKACHAVDMLKRNSISPRSVCDVGCGSGETIAAMSRLMGPDVSFAGYEPSPQAFEICAAKAGGPLSFFNAGLEAVPDGGFDVVMALDIVEHVEDCFGFLRELGKKGRHKILHIPLDMTALSAARPAALVETRRTFGHIHFFCKDTALAALERVGLRTVDWAYTGSSTDFPAPGAKMKLLNAVRKAAFRVSPDAAVRLLGGWSLLVLAE